MSNQILLLNLLVEAGIPAYVEGARGTAKSSILAGLGRSLGRRPECVISSIREPADFGGLPVVREFGVELHAPAWAHRLQQSKRGLLFLDEITHAPHAVQAALMRVINDRVVGDLELGSHVSIVAAGNGAGAMGNNAMMDAMRNRFAHIQWALPLESWFDGALTGFADPVATQLPDGWEAGIPTTLSRIVSFLRKNPALAETSEEAAVDMMAFPTLRTWTMAARALAAAQSIGYGPDSEISHALVNSLVGEAASRTYTVWVQQQDLPDPEEVLANAATYKLPTRGDRISVMLDGVVAACLSQGTRTSQQVIARYAAAWVVMARCMEAGHKDIAFPSGMVLAKRRPNGAPVPQAAGALGPILQAAGLMPTK